MLYVLVNFHLDLKRSRDESMHHRRSRVERVRKIRDEVPIAYYTPAQKDSTPTKTHAGVRHGICNVSQEFVLRRTL